LRRQQYRERMGRVRRADERANDRAGLGGRKWKAAAMSAMYRSAARRLSRGQRKPLSGRMLGQMMVMRSRSDEEGHARTGKPELAPFEISLSRLDVDRTHWINLPSCRKRPMDRGSR